jgi:hypothetical protein
MQRAFMEEQAAQCGYCIPGMMMRAQALLESQPGADEAQIRKAPRAQPVPLRHAHADPSRRGPGREAHGLEGMSATVSRRRFLASGSALVVSFALSPSLRAQGAPKLPGSLEKSPMLDSWIGVGGDGTITVFTGKAELGQGIRTALGQLAAEGAGRAPSSASRSSRPTPRARPTKVIRREATR